MAYNTSLPGNDFFREEFHYSMPFILVGIAVSHNPVLIFLIYVFSSLYLVYGTFGQLGILQSNVDLFFDNSAGVSANQEEAWGYLYASTTTWLSTALFCAIVIRLWWRDDFRSFVTWRNVDILSLVCILNAFTVVLSPSVIEFWLLTRFISDDWGVFGYFLIAVVSRIVFTLYQGASNGVLMITNMVFIYNVWSVYWRIAKLPYVQVLTIVSLVVASIDIVYRLLLLKWSVEKAAVIGKNVAIMSLRTGIQNTEIPPKNVPMYFPRSHHYEVLLIDRRRLRFLGRPYNNFPPTCIPLNIIGFAALQPPQNHPIYQINNRRVAEELNIIHCIHDQEHT